MGKCSFQNGLLITSLPIKLIKIEKHHRCRQLTGMFKFTTNTDDTIYDDIGRNLRADSVSFELLTCTHFVTILES